MPKAKIVVEFDWPDMPLGPINDMRLYEDRMESRRRTVQRVIEMVEGITDLVQRADFDVQVWRETQLPGPYQRGQ
jgi:hypothetical protein